MHPALDLTRTPASAPLTVFVIHPSEMMQLAWHSLISHVEGLLIIGSGSKVEEALRAATEGWADLVLIDRSTDGADGTIIAGALRSSGCPARVAFTGDHPDRHPNGETLDLTLPVRDVTLALNNRIDALFSHAIERQ